MTLQPHEGVEGTDRSGDPILTSSAQGAILVLAFQMHGLALAAHGRPAGAQFWDRMRNPRRGDLVAVTDALIPRNRPDRQAVGVGYLVERRAEWASTDAEWAAAREEEPDLTDEHRAIEKDAYYIQHGPEPADVVRWTNCTVHALPTTIGVQW